MRGMERIARTLALAVCLALPALASASGAEFRCDRVLNGKKIGVFYQKGDWYRSEMLVLQESLTIVRLNRRDCTGMVIHVNQKSKTYDVSIAPVPRSVFDREIGARTSFRRVGVEKIGRYDCVKYVMTWQAGNGKPAGKMTRWFSRKLNLVMKEVTEGARLVTTEYTNIKEGPLPDSLFQAPKGYTMAHKYVADSGDGKQKGGSTQKKPESSPEQAASAPSRSAKESDSRKR